MKIKQSPVYEFKIVNISDIYMEIQPLVYQKQGWEFIAASEPRNNGGMGYVAFTLRRIIKEKRT